MTHDVIRADFCGAFNVDTTTFDSMARQVAERNRWHLDDAAEALRSWALEEISGEGAATIGWDLSNPVDVAAMLGSYHHTRVWAALLGHAART
ncbi:MAG: hypothetical protein GY788_21210 [bacterium]|nr:hypothetical protein [bacterium]